MTNIFPDMAPWEYEALKEHIRHWGVILPVVMDENGNIIDGRQRIRACAELGIESYPALTLAGLTDEEKHDHSFILNLVRRRLNQQQMRDLIAAELRRTPDLSDNWLAQILGTTDKTVASVREQLIATSEIPKLEKLRCKDGKHRRVTRMMTYKAEDVGPGRKLEPRSSRKTEPFELSERGA
jgi:ParB-like chromosome segregation protein Spo0J